MARCEFDVAIAGAGPAGSAAAYFLSNAGLRVALLDQGRFPRDKPCGDGLTPRAIKLLSSMRALPTVERDAFRCTAIKLRHSDEVTFTIELDHLTDLAHYCLVQPRLTLDELLRRHAVDAGASFFAGARVETFLPAADGTLRVQINEATPISCRVGIVATGASATLGRSLGLKARGPPSRAARVYFDNVADLEPAFVIFFDGVEMPGYGWVFPVSPTSANIGCGVFGGSRTSQPAQLRRLIAEHPYLRRALRHARQAGPIKGYALRTDFAPERSGSGRVLVIGESAGLVHPMTGEGVDYALESAKLAADVVAGAFSGEIDDTQIELQYRRALSRAFRWPLTCSRIAQRLYFRGCTLPNLLRRAQHKSYLRRAIVEACFGHADPHVLIGPRTLWEVFGP